MVLAETSVLVHAINFSEESRGVDCISVLRELYGLIGYLDRLHSAIGGITFVRRDSSPVADSTAVMETVN